MNDSPSPTAETPFWSNRRLQLVIIFLVALALRGAFVVHYGPILTNDSTYYLSVAEGIQQGNGLGLPYRSPPMYPLFLASILSVVPSHVAVIWAQAVLGALACVFVAMTCQRLFRPAVAFWFGLAVAVYAPMASYCVPLLRETMIGLGVSVTVYFVVRSLQDPRMRWLWCAGVAYSFTVFNQATFIFFVGWLGIAYWIHSRSLKTAIVRVIPVIACIAATIGVWSARNFHMTGHFIPISADHLGYFFLEGIMDANKEKKALTPAQLQYLGIPEDDPYNTYGGMRDYYWGLGPYSGTGGLERKLKDGPVLFHRALKLAQHDPKKYLRFSVQRLHRLWCKDLWVERTEESYLNLRPLDRFRETKRIGPMTIVLIVYAFGYSSLLGMVIFGKRTLVLLVPIVAMLSFHMWVHAETRYALAIHPYLLIYSLLAVMFLWLRVIRQRKIEKIIGDILTSSDNLRA